MTIPNIWKNKKCSKPPISTGTGYGWDVLPYPTALVSLVTWDILGQPASQVWGLAQASPLYCNNLVSSWLAHSSNIWQVQFWVGDLEIWCPLFICLLLIITIIEFEWMNSHLDARWKTNCTVGGVLCRCFSWICDCNILKWWLDNGKPT